MKKIQFLQFVLFGVMAGNINLKDLWPTSATGQAINDTGELLLDDIASLHGVSGLTLIGGGLASTYRTKKGWTDVNLAGVNAQRMDVEKGGGLVSTYRTKKGWTDVNLSGVNAQRMDVEKGGYRERQSNRFRYRP
jgi:hypothetical protein